MNEKDKKIVIYFSYTNHTRMVAEKIAEKLNCDILEIKTILPYSNNYDLVVKEEQNSSDKGKMPEIEKIDINLNDYSEIILGTPVWWYSIAPAIRTFLSQNDLSGKIIVPFVTNAGWLGQTVKEIKTFCPNSVVKNEINILFTSDYSENKLITTESEINNWINSL